MYGNSKVLLHSKSQTEATSKQQHPSGPPTSRSQQPLALPLLKHPQPKWDTLRSGDVPNAQLKDSGSNSSSAFVCLGLNSTSSLYPRGFRKWPWAFEGGGLAVTCTEAPSVCPGFLWKKDVEEGCWKKCPPGLLHWGERGGPGRHCSPLHPRFTQSSLTSLYFLNISVAKKKAWKLLVLNKTQRGAEGTEGRKSSLLSTYYVQGNFKTS